MTTDLIIAALLDVRGSKNTELAKVRKALRRAYGLNRMADRYGRNYWIAQVDGAWISTLIGRGMSVEDFAAKLAR